MSLFHQTVAYFDLFTVFYDLLQLQNEIHLNFLQFTNLRIED